MTTADAGAEINRRGDAIVMVTHALFGPARITDWDGHTETLAMSHSDAHLGAALRACLANSRARSDDWMRAQMRANDQDHRLALAFGLKGSRSLFPGMKSVLVDQSMKRITLGPTRHRRGGSFEGFEKGADHGHEAVVVPPGVADDDLGAAIREALRRCL
jgi:hypothetical protein